MGSCNTCSSHALLFLPATPNPSPLPTPICLAPAGKKMTPFLMGWGTCYEWYLLPVLWWFGEEVSGETPSVVPSVQTRGKVPQATKGILLWGPCGDPTLLDVGHRDFLEKAARTGWRRGRAGSRPSQEAPGGGDRCVSGAAGPSGARREVQDGDRKWGWTKARV